MFTWIDMAVLLRPYGYTIDYCRSKTVEQLNEILREIHEKKIRDEKIFPENLSGAEV